MTSSSTLSRSGAIALCLWFLSAGGDAARSAPFPDTPVTAPEERSWSLWVEDLKHSQWKRRAGAERHILEQGPAILADSGAMEALRRLIFSGDPEAAYRARYLLTEIDPSIGRFHILKVELGPTPTLVEEAHARGGSASKITARVNTHRERPPSTYQVVWRPTPPFGVDVEVHVSRPRNASATVLRSPLRTAPAVGVLDLGAETLYRTTGSRFERQRFRYATFIYQRLIEPDTPAAADGEELLAEVAEVLRRQAKDGTLDERLQALRLLGLLRRPDALPLFREALDEPRTRVVAALGIGALGAPDAAAHLAALLENHANVLSEASAPAFDDPAADELRAGNGEAARAPALRQQAFGDLVRAAALLSEMGDERGGRFLIERLAERDFSQAHTLMATLADTLSQIPPHGALAREILATALSEDVLAHASWSDRETPHFVMQCLNLMVAAAAKDNADTKEAARVVELLEELVAGGFPPNAPQLATIVPLWRKARGVADGRPSRAGDEIGLIRRLLGGKPSEQALEEIVRWLADDYPGEPLAADFFDAVVSCLKGIFEQEGGVRRISLRSAAGRSILKLSQELMLADGQLGPWVELLVFVASKSSSSTSRSAVRELERWSGVKATKPRTSGARVDVTPWQRWLEDREQIARKEREHLLEQEDSAPDGPRLVYRQFDIDLPADRPLASTGGEPGLTLLGAMRKTLHPNRTLRYVDRHGSRESLRLGLDRSAAGGAQRVRLNNAHTLTLGVPGLIDLEGARIREEWIETSDSSPGSRFLSHSQRSSARSVVLVDVLAAGESPPADIEPRGLAAADVAALWESFLRDHLLALPKDATRPQVDARIQLLRQLQLPRTTDFLKQLLATHPTIEIAKLLHELGDASGRDHLRRELGKADAGERIAAAQALSDLGEWEGLEVLLNLAQEDPALFRRQFYRVVQAIDRFLKASPPDDARRLVALDFLFENLANSQFQYLAFKIIEREAGRDFSYQEARRIRQSRDRRAAIERSVEEARLWWSREKKARGLEEKATPRRKKATRL